jgi:hypothetical protein
MTLRLIVHGPINIPVSRAGNSSVKRISDENKRAFLIQLEELQLERKQGCYIFALRAGRGYCPWYIGKTNRCFAYECIGPHQLEKYNEVLFSGRKGLPVMFFVAPDGRKKTVSRRVCDDLESYLINQAFQENAEIANGRKLNPAWMIKGVFGLGRGRPSELEERFQLMMGI